MDHSKMESPSKKGLSLSVQRGRPRKGALSTYPKEVRDLITRLRIQHGGWGAITILVELESGYGYSKTKLPSEDAVNRFLKESGFIPPKEPKGFIPSSKCSSAVKRFHDLWELDAQGAIAVEGLGYQAMINIKDVKSKAYCMSFPVQVKGNKSQPKTPHYLWALRLAFEEFGLPKAIQVDRDSVFIDNTSKSPFPSRVQLFLVGLGIELCFIDAPPPQKQSTVERSHQTLDGQVTKGQHYKIWQSLFTKTNERRKVLNEKYPSRSLGKKAPLEKYPKARHAGRFYTIQQEQTMIDMRRIYKFLAQCRWYRKVSKVKTISINATVYYLKNAKPYSQLQITFCNRTKKLLFRDDKELVVAKLPLKDFSIQKIMGATTQQLISMKNRLFNQEDFPL